MPIKATIFGAGGHAKVVVDALVSTDFLSGNLRIIDENEAIQGQNILGYQIEALDPDTLHQSDKFHVAIGNGIAREALMLRLGISKHKWLTIVHSHALISPKATVGAGTFIAAGAIIGPDTDIGNVVIINHGAIIYHDCRVSYFATISPRSVLCGGVENGRQAKISASATLLPGIKIGDGAAIGAGAVVLTSVPPQETWAGVPARKIPYRAQGI
jgi:sugar O-acyltransferase (sialic acid O-acetyltransferase NeuD family)